MHLSTYYSTILLASLIVAGILLVFPKINRSYLEILTSITTGLLGFFATSMLGLDLGHNTGDELGIFFFMGIFYGTIIFFLLSIAVLYLFKIYK